jgi:hypothetical protein
MSEYLTTLMTDERPYTTTEVIASPLGPIEAACELKATGSRPALLTFGDPAQAGGAVATGGIGQEEDLFRRSNYYKSLNQEFYPLGDYDCLVCTRVKVYRKGATDSYAFMLPRKIDCFMMSRAKLQEDAECLVRVAALTTWQRQNDSLVVPAEIPAEVAQKVVKDEFDGKFAKLVLSVGASASA